MIRSMLFFPLFLIATIIFVGNVSAAVNCQPIYGGGQTCVSTGEIQIDKKVRNPENGTFVDNLSINETRYHAGESITFKIHVTNTGDDTLSSVEVKDVLPQYVTYVSSPGSYDRNAKTITYTLSDLKAKETRTSDIVVKVVGESSLPLGEGIVCTVNQGSATANRRTSQDNSQFCIEKITAFTKGGLPVMPAPKIYQTPPTGPEMLPLIGLIPAGLAGLLIRRRSISK